MVKVAGHRLTGADVDVVHLAAVATGGRRQIPTCGHSLTGIVASAGQDQAAVVRCGGVGKLESLVKRRRSTRQGEVEKLRITGRVGHLVDDDLPTLDVGKGTGDGLAGADIDVVHRAAVATGGRRQVPACGHGLAGVVARTGDDQTAVVRCGGVGKLESLVERRRSTCQGEIEQLRVTTGVSHLVNDNLPALGVSKRTFDGLACF